MSSDTEKMSRAKTNDTRVVRVYEACTKWEKVYSSSVVQALDALASVADNYYDMQDVCYETLSPWLKERGWYEYYNKNNWVKPGRTHPEFGLPPLVAMFQEMNLMTVATGCAPGVAFRIK